MAHPRQQIREQMLATLTGLTTTGANVYDTKLNAYGDFPCITIITGTDTVDEDKSSNPKHWHDLAIRLEVRARVASTVANEIDTICAEIEAAIYADRTLNAKLVDVIISQTQIEYSVEAEVPIGLATLSLSAAYRVIQTDPMTISN